MKILVIGGSFGGVTAAYHLRRRLPRRECEITVISKERRFIFIPSLPWVAMGSKTVADISFDLERPLERKEIGFVETAVARIDPDQRKVHTETEVYDYDILLIATGHRSANEAVPGLGPFDGPGHSLMSPPEAEEARDAWAAFLEDPGPMVIGAAPGASCIGPAYEFAFEVHHMLSSRRRRHKVARRARHPLRHLRGDHAHHRLIGRARRRTDVRIKVLARHPAPRRSQGGRRVAGPRQPERLRPGR
jgi:sulfide:quinone oxidoreductase